MSPEPSPRSSARLRCIPPEGCHFISSSSFIEPVLAAASSRWRAASAAACRDWWGCELSPITAIASWAALRWLATSSCAADYKTNRSLGRESLAAYGRQLAIYQRASREVLGIDASALLVEMRTGAVHRQEGDGWPEVETLLGTLVGGDRSAPPDPPCGGCAYWRGCPSSTRRPGNDPRP